MLIKRALVVFLVLLICFLKIEPVLADDPLWELGIGAAGLYLPDYRGSDEGSFYLLPYPYVIYRGDILRVDKDRISGRVFETDRLLFDVSFYGGVPVDSDDNRARRGMPDLDPTFEVGPSLNMILLKDIQDRYKLSLNLPVRAVFSTDFSDVRHQGWVFSPRLNFELNDIASSGVRLGLSAGPIFGDEDYHDYYYTVDPVYATPSRRAYSARSGYSGSAVTLGMNKALNSFILSAFISMDFLDGAEIENSPLVTTNHSLMGGVTITWVFLKSAKKITAKPNSYPR